MKLNKKIISQLDLNNITNPIGGTCWINESKTEQLLKNVHVLEFNSLYPTLAIGLYNEGLLPKKYSKDIQRIDEFVKNHKELKQSNPNTYLQEKIFVNSYYGRLVRDDIKYSNLIPQYMNIMYQDIILEQSRVPLNNNQDELIYIDTDMIFYQNVLTLGELYSDVLTYEMSTMEYLYMGAKKRYVYYNKDGDGVIVSKGYRRSSGSFDKQIIELEGMIRSEIRSDKLNKIGI